MFAQTYGSTTFGLNGVLITVEIDIANGIPGLDIVGLPDAAVREARERVRAAIKNSGFEFPARRITVNLAPADLKKDSSGLDLPIAVGILAASGQLPRDRCVGCCFLGELSLEGKLRGISGLLPMALNCAANEVTTLFVAPTNSQEALLAPGLTIYAPETLSEVVSHFRGEKPCIPKDKETSFQDTRLSVEEDFADVQGQFLAKRALEIAAAGGHNVLMIGPPGSGKTMLARRITSILPPMIDQEALEVTKIYSVAGLYRAHGLISTRPFRNPHHTISTAGMIGGGTIPRPGEVTLSHNGVLFLDELPEFPRAVLEVLRQPLEDGQVTISRVNASLSYPAKMMLIAAMNPCPCGFLHDSTRSCSCSPGEIRRYAKKISGPLLDRIDIHVQVPRLNYSDIIGGQAAESSAQIAARVAKARLLQSERLNRLGLTNNSQMGHKHIKTTCPLTTGAQSLLKQAFTKMNLSARSYDRVIKVARTIADIGSSSIIDEAHIAEAIGLRNDFQNMNLDKM